MRLFQIVEVAPHVGPTRGLLNATALVELIEPRVGIRLQDATELLQMPLRMFPFAIRRVGEPYRGRRPIARGTIIANVGPQSPRLGLALTRRDEVAPPYGSPGKFDESRTLCWKVIFPLFLRPGNGQV